MEDKSNSRAPKVTRRLILQEGKFEYFPDAINITQADNSIQVSDKSSSIYHLPHHESNLYSLQLLKKNNLNKSRSKLLQFFKQKGNIDTKISSFVKKSEHLKDLHSLKKEFHEIQLKLSHPEELAKFILNLNSFHGFETCQVLIHEKGKSFAENYHFEKTSGHKNESIEVTEFNSIFNHIKKSKSKQFSQLAHSKEVIGAIGTFLAKEFKSTNYRFIIIISRNDFLPPTEKEKEKFNLLTTYIFSIFDRLLKDKFLIQKGEMIESTLQIYPIPLTILDQNGYILKNKLFNDLNDISQEHLNKINLKNDHTLLFREALDDEDITSLHHFKRVTLLGELLNTLRHELNNPLFGLKLAADLLKEMASGEHKETLSEISQNSERCQTIIKNFSHLYEEKNTFTTTDLKKLMYESLTLTKSETKIIGRTIEFKDLSDDQTILLETNPTWLSQIIFNLVINSAQALKVQEGHKNINIEVALSEDKVRIRLFDNGPGIPKEMKDKIFSPFFTTKKDGTGLGLAICSELVKRLKGDLKMVTPKEGFNTCFELTLKNSSPRVIRHESVNN